MDKNSLKLISLNLLKESKVAENEKAKVLSFVKEASAEELLVYALTEKAVKLTEAQKQVINEKYGYLYEGAGKTILSVLGLLNSPVLWVIYRAIISADNECHKKCGTFKINTTERQGCLKECEDIKQKKLAGMKGKINCKQSKNPQRCEEMKRTI